MARSRHLVGAAVLVLGLLAACSPAAPPPAPTAAPAKPAAAQPAAQPAAAQPAAAGGFTVLTSHDEIVANANKEGKVKVLFSLDPPTAEALVTEFNKVYPNIDVTVEQLTGTDAYQRFQLELKASPPDWDVVYTPPEYYEEFASYFIKYDFAAMSENGALKIPVKMVDPTLKNVAAFGSQFGVLAYNKKLMTEAQVPKTWDDLLKPEFKGKKFGIDIRPANINPLAAEWGVDRVADFAKKIGQQEPIWANGQTPMLTRLAAGDLPMAVFVNYHDTVTVQEKSPDTMGYVIVEPVPARISITLGVMEAGKNHNAGLLWMEFMASPPAQKVLDELEPLKSSLYAPGSKVALALEGKQTSVADFKIFSQLDGIAKRIVEGFGFPTAEIQ